MVYAYASENEANTDAPIHAPFHARTHIMYIHTLIHIRTTPIAIYEVRETPNIADANGIPDAG